MSDFNVSMGNCIHSKQEAEEAGEDWLSFINNKLGHRYTGKDYNRERMDDWSQQYWKLMEKYNRPVVWVGPEEFYSVNLCAECLRELLAEVESYEYGNKQD